MMKTKVTLFISLVALTIFPFLAYKASQEPLPPEEQNMAEKRFDVTKEQEFVIVVPSYNNEAYYQKNLDSIFSQEYQNFRVIYINDASSDNTGACVEAYVKEKGLESKIAIWNNEINRKAMYNLYTAIHSCPNSAIVIIVDGDDWLYHPNVLKELNQVYANEDVWLTYGQYMRYPDNQIGCCAPVTKSFLREAKAREGKWQYTHLRTFYAGLFKKIALEDLLLEGRFFDATYDLAIMFPMLEMARDHAYFIRDVNYVYNYATPLNDAKVRLKEQQRIEKMLRKKPIYEALLTHPKDLTTEDSCDLVVFSYNRPMQLYAFLESVEKRVKGLSQTSVIFRADEHFESGYKIVQEAFPYVRFVQQSKTAPRKDFKPLVMDLSFGLKAGNSSYIIYGVDDIVITEDIDIKNDIKKLEETRAYGFYYRLGNGIDYCYTEDREQGVPELLELEKDLYTWQFKRGKADWRYANSLDFVLYAKQDIEEDFANLFFSYPNDLEGGWAKMVDTSRLGLCHKETKMVNIPLNLVTAIPNRNLNLYSPHALNEMFLAGLKIDIEALAHVKHNSAHANVEVQFVPREFDLLEEEPSIALGE
ncbi:MAG: glycosyltransferase family 2 protein [Verrucomicrobia bacterium]|nr:glycosyltransferase family 2 protein [Verrucomicrobiota bacterium]